LSQYNNTFIEDQSKNIWQKVQEQVDAQLQDIELCATYRNQYDIFHTLMKKKNEHEQKLQIIHNQLKIY
jgi:hypothetical protein